MRTLIHPAPAGLRLAVASQQISEADLVLAKSAIRKTRGNIPQAGGILRKKMSLPQVIAVLSAIA